MNIYVKSRVLVNDSSIVLVFKGILVYWGLDR